MLAPPLSIESIDMLASFPPRADEAKAEPALRRILICAAAVSPERGSEPGVGWNICSRLAQYYDITVLTDAGRDGEYRQEIDRFLAANGPIRNLTFRFAYSPTSRFLRRESGPARAFYYLGYAFWQRAAAIEAARIHQEKAFDLVHHLNFIGYREPGFLWSLGLPFVWGPVGGADDVPWSYFTLLSWRECAIYGTRNIINSWQKRFARRPRRAAKAARKIWVVSKQTKDLITGMWTRPTELLTETGTSPRPATRVVEPDPKRPFRIVWSGQHIGRKAFPILLHALTRIEHPIELLVLGEGPETARWRALSVRMGLSSRVRWAGHLHRQAALAEMECADVLAFTSVKEGTPHVVLEALALGLPVICHDSCGMGVVVDDTCGIKVPMRSPRESIDGFTSSLLRLLKDRGALRSLSHGAVRRARMLSWDEKARQIAAGYEESFRKDSVASVAV